MSVNARELETVRGPSGVGPVSSDVSTGQLPFSGQSMDTIGLGIKSDLVSREQALGVLLGLLRAENRQINSVIKSIGDRSA